MAQGGFGHSGERVEQGAAGGDAHHHRSLPLSMQSQSDGHEHRAALVGDGMDVQPHLREVVDDGGIARAGTQHRIVRCSGVVRVGTQQGGKDIDVVFVAIHECVVWKEYTKVGRGLPDLSPCIFHGSTQSHF